MQRTSLTGGMPMESRFSNEAYFFAQMLLLTGSQDFGNVSVVVVFLVYFLQPLDEFWDVQLAKLGRKVTTC